MIYFYCWITRFLKGDNDEISYISLFFSTALIVSCDLVQPKYDHGR